MDEDRLKKFVGSRIRELRKKKKLTQKELGEKIGVKDNTITSYEKGVNQLNQETLFKLARALDCRVDDFFPSTGIETSDNLERALMMSKNLNTKDINFLKGLIEKALSMSKEERAKFLDSIRFTVEYYEKMNKD